MFLRDEVHSVSVVFEALLPIFGEIPQHLQRPHADGDVILVCPDLQSNEHHTRVQLLFEDLPLKQRERILNSGDRKVCLMPLHTRNIHLEGTIVCTGEMKWYNWKRNSGATGSKLSLHLLESTRACLQILSKYWNKSRTDTDVSI